MMSDSLHNKKPADILVVDDTIANLKLLSDLLNRQGYNVRPATNGADALEAVERRKPELILLDIHMPDMDGYEVCRRLKANPTTSEIPIIFITASNDPEGAVKGLELGAVDYINKPIQQEEVLARLATHLDLSQKNRELAEARSLLEQRVKERTAELLQSKEKFRALVETTQDIIWEINAEGIFTYCSPQTKEILGYRPEELLGKRSFDIMSTEEVKRVGKAFKDALEQKVPVNKLENINLTKDGRSVVLETSGRPFFNSSGELGGYRGVDRDITERKQTEDALSRSRFQLNEAQKMAHLGSWTLDIEENKLSWSDEVFNIFELDKEQFNASYEAFIDKIHPDDRELVNNAYAQSLEKKTPYNIEHRLLMKDGRIKYVHEQFETNFDEEGKPLQSIGTIQDVTERKLAEIELQQSRERLRDLSNHLLQVREDEKQSIAREVHDEIGGTLSAILLDANWLQEKLDNKYRETALRIAEMTESVLISIQRIVTELRPTLLDEMGLRPAVEWLLSEFEKRTGIQSIFDKELCEKCTEEGRCNITVFTPKVSIVLFRVVQEALTNVSRHAAASRVNVGCQVSGRFVVFSIIDNGIGFDTALIEKASSYGIRGMLERVESLGEYLEIDSNKNIGTRITIRLPRNGYGKHE